MKFTNEIEVAAPKEQVWAVFQDVHSVVPCLPGAEVLSEDEDGTVNGRLRAKLGPLSLAFNGEVKLSYAEADSVITIDGTGVDRRGGSRAGVTVVAELEAEGDATLVTLHTDLKLAGRAAQFGRTGLLEEVSSKMLHQFATCLESKLAAGLGSEEAAAISADAPSGGKLLLSSLGSMMRKNGNTTNADEGPDTGD